MNITILQGAFFPVPPLLGGAVEKMWFRLGQEFAAKGHQVTHVSRLYGDLPTEETISGVYHVRVAGYDQPSNVIKLKWLDLLYSRRVCKVVPLESDVVVTNTFWSPLLLPKAIRSKVYVNVERVPKGQMKWYSAAARLRGPSSAITNAIRSELPQNRHKQVLLIPNPFPFTPPTSLDRRAKEDCLLYCGRIHPEKGLEILVDASVGLDWPVLIVGPYETRHGGGGEEYLQSLRQRAIRKGSKATFLDPIFDVRELNDAYNRASIFVYPSIAEFGDAGPVAPREAMAWGCVPVVSALDCFKDIVRHYHNGCIFNHRSTDPAKDLHSLLRSLMENRPIREKLAKEAAMVSRSHSPSRIADFFIADFERTCQQNPSMA